MHAPSRQHRAVGSRQWKGACKAGSSDTPAAVEVTMWDSLPPEMEKVSCMKDGLYWLLAKLPSGGAGGARDASSLVMEA